MRRRRGEQEQSASFMAEGLRWVQVGGAVGRYDAEEQRHGAGERERPGAAESSGDLGSESAGRRGGRRAGGRGRRRRPIEEPTSPSSSASSRNCWRMSRRRAPIDMRRPISRVRCSTDARRMFMIPTPPTMTETAAAMMKTTISPNEIARATLDDRRHRLDLEDRALVVAVAQDLLHRPTRPAGSPRTPAPRRRACRRAASA